MASLLYLCRINSLKALHCSVDFIFQFISKTKLNLIKIYYRLSQPKDYIRSRILPRVPSEARNWKIISFDCVKKGTASYILTRKKKNKKDKSWTFYIIFYQMICIFHLWANVRAKINYTVACEEIILHFAR